MATRWSPDTCDCVIEYNGAVYEATIKTCKHPAHIAVSGTPAHKTVIEAHNRSYNLKHGSMDIPGGWKDELDIRGLGVNQRALATSLGRNDVIDWLDKQEEISNDKRVEKQRIKDL